MRFYMNNSPLGKHFWKATILQSSTIWFPKTESKRSAGISGDRIRLAYSSWPAGRGLVTGHVAFLIPYQETKTVGNQTFWTCCKVSIIHIRFDITVLNFYQKKQHIIHNMSLIGSCVYMFTQYIYTMISYHVTLLNHQKNVKIRLSKAFHDGSVESKINEM